MHTICADCGEAITLVVEASADQPVRAIGAGGAPLGDVVLHFAVPASRWWDDIGFT